MEDIADTPAFSSASIRKVAIPGPAAVRAAGYREIALPDEHAAAGGRLPPLHKDPSDRILIAQAEVQGATLLAMDATVARYPGPVQLVG